MDQTGCSPGYFTDRFFPGHEGATAAPCLFPVASWVVIGVLFGAVRLLCALVTLYVWREKRAAGGRSKLSTAPPKPAAAVGATTLFSWFPIQPLASLGVALSVCLFVILTSANVANSSNGAPVFLIATFCLCGSVSHFFFTRKLLRLGKALLQSHRLDASGELVARVSRTDVLLKTLIVLSVASCLVAFPVALSQLARPLDVGIFQAVFSIIGVYSLTQPLMIAWQLHRIVRAMDTTRLATKDTRMPGAVSDQDHKINRTKRKIRSQQIGVLVVAGVAALLNFLIASRAVPASWVIVGMPHFAYEVVFEVFSLWNLHRKGLSSKEGNSGSKTNSHNAKRQVQATAGTTMSGNQGESFQGSAFGNPGAAQTTLAPQSSFYSSVA